MQTQICTYNVDNRRLRTCSQQSFRLICHGVNGSQHDPLLTVLQNIETYAPLNGRFLDKPGFTDTNYMHFWLPLQLQFLGFSFQQRTSGTFQEAEEPRYIFSLHCIS